MTNEDYVKNLTSGARGGFARAIGEAWLRADSGNRAKIEATWPNYFSVPLPRDELLQLLADAQEMMSPGSFVNTEYTRVYEAIARVLKGAE